ncbi:hypothetical protein EV176_006763, partial [Coemansia sp. RSA 451]
MEPRVLVVSLFAPYSVNFDAGPKTPSSGGGASSVHERQIGRSGSTGRSAVWNGRRSSMHRTHTTPLGRHAEPHSRRRSTFSINAVKLAPISRNSSKTSDGGNATSPCDKPGAYLTPCNEGDGADPAEASNEGAAAADTSRITDKPGPSQLAYSIEEAAGAHTPSPNTLDFTRKLNIDQMREKQERKTGAGKHGRMLHNKLTKAEPDAEVRQTPPGGWYGSALATGADSTLAKNIAAAVDDDGSGDMTPGPQIGTQLPKKPQTTLTDAVAAETDDPFT